jgi:hypothetical protein
MLSVGAAVVVAVEAVAEAMQAADIARDHMEWLELIRRNGVAPTKEQQTF